MYELLQLIKLVLGFGFDFCFYFSSCEGWVSSFSNLLIFAVILSDEVSTTL
jgi:hypothetical protein